jgi:hypothetical protein
VPSLASRPLTDVAMGHPAEMRRYTPSLLLLVLVGAVVTAALFLFAPQGLSSLACIGSCVAFHGVSCSSDSFLPICCRRTHM